MELKRVFNMPKIGPITHHVPHFREKVTFRDKLKTYYNIIRQILHILGFLKLDNGTLPDALKVSDSKR